MVKIRLRYVVEDTDRHGNPRLYFCRKGQPKVRLPGLPGSDEFMAAYEAALRANPPVGCRGHNFFKQKDGLRAIKIARDGGMKPAMLEIAAKDGTTYRVYEQEAAAAKQAAQGSNPWDQVSADATDKKRLA